MKQFTIVPRVEHDGTPTLFWLDETGELTCYAHVGGHSTGSRQYYLTRTKPEKNYECTRLLREYENLPGGDGCVFVVGKRLAPVREVDMPCDLADFVHAYATAALWSSTDENGEPLDSRFDVSDIAPKTMRQMLADCLDFIRSNSNAIRQYCNKLDVSQAGHDFWLTRNRHGAGFWDRGLGKLGERLTQSAKVYNGVDLYLGADGLIHV